MCRSIKPLRGPDIRPTDEEIRAAALQFVRKVSGYRQPSLANQAVFETAVVEIAAVTKRMLEGIADNKRLAAKGSGQRAEAA